MGSRLQRILDDHGFVLVRQKKHRVYRNGEGRTFVTSASPSDVRWERNAIAILKRITRMSCVGGASDQRPATSDQQPEASEIVGQCTHCETASDSLQRPELSVQSPASSVEVPPTDLTRSERQWLNRQERRQQHRERRRDKVLDAVCNWLDRVRELIDSGYCPACLAECIADSAARRGYDSELLVGTFAMTEAMSDDAEYLLIRINNIFVEPGNGLITSRSEPGFTLDPEKMVPVVDGVAVCRGRHE